MFVSRRRFPGRVTVKRGKLLQLYEKYLPLEILNLVVFYASCLHVGEPDAAKDPLCQVFTIVRALFVYTGSIPEVLGSFTRLTKLTLRDNQLTGEPVFFAGSFPPRGLYLEGMKGSPDE